METLAHHEYATSSVLDKTDRGSALLLAQQSTLTAPLVARHGTYYTNRFAVDKKLL